MTILVPRVAYAKDTVSEHNRLRPVNVNSKHCHRPKNWGKWAKDYPVVGHNHLDPPDHFNRDTLSAESRRKVSVKGGKASTRAGIRDGFGGHRELQAEIDQAFLEEGHDIVAIMIERGLVDKEATGNDALAYAVGVIRDEKQPAGLKLQAAKLVLDFTMAKPASKSEVKLETEDFLAQLAREAAERRRASE